jgi:hypothetical protein
MATILECQLSELEERFGAVEASRLPSGTMLVTVPRVTLPPGWSACLTAVRFLVPPAYPFAAPDCFWVDDSLRLAGGALPQNAGNSNVIPETNISGLWFSWHLAGPWDPNRDTLSSWTNVIMDRLRRAQ